MADDERLREALLELQVLREREARALGETSALLGAIEAFATAPSPGDAVDALFGALARVCGAALAVLVERAGPSGTCTLIHGSDAARVGQSVLPPAELFGRPRNLNDLHRLGTWSGPLDMAGFRSLMCVTLPADDTGTDRAVWSLHPDPAAFTRAHLQFQERLAALFGRALATERLAADNALLAAVIEGSSSGFAIADATRRDAPLVYVNRAFEQLSGYTATEVLGTNCRLLTDEPPDSAERKRLREAVRARSGGRFTLRNRRKTGERFWNELTLFPVRDGAGITRHLVATQSDVTDRVAAEQERDALRQLMSRALAIIEDGFLMLDADDSILLSNEAMRAAFPAAGPDWRPGTGFDENWQAYVGVLGVAGRGRGRGFPVRPDLEGLAAAPHGQEIALPDGRSFLMRAKRDADGPLVVTATNITRLKTIEALLRQRVAAIEAAFDGIVIVNEAGRILYLNSSAAAHFGFDRPPMALGRSWRRVYLADGDDAPGADGTIQYRRAASDGRVLTHEIARSELDGGGAVLIVRDITARLAEEARHLEMQAALSRAQRQEALSQLAAGVAHDFNNLLSAINGSALLIERDATGSDPVRDHARRITAAGNRAARLVNRLLDLGAGPRHGSAFELRTALSDVPEVVASSLPPNVTLGMDTGREHLLLDGDPSDVNQIAVNLVLNARDAIGSAGGRITLALGAVTPERARALDVGVLSAGRRYARISVADTGSGMDADTVARIFEPHFSTKGPRGTGLGLAMAAVQSRAAGGGIEVDSIPGKGTTFHVYWPLRPLVAPDSAPEGRGEGPSLAGATLLVVDDDTEVGEVLQAFLEGLGAEVALCDAPELAAEAVAEDPEAWTALVTDYDMPGMSGGDLVEQVREHAPDLPIFLVTALARRLTDPRVGPDRIAGLFAKPVDLSELARALAALPVRVPQEPQESSG